MQKHNQSPSEVALMAASLQSLQRPKSASSSPNVAPGRQWRGQTWMLHWAHSHSSRSTAAEQMP
eukprot:4092663-Prymnesium_polylepis.1